MTSLDNQHLVKLGTEDPAAEDSMDSTRSVGRPRAISGLQVEKLIELLKKGYAITLACRKSGISSSTYYVELARNEEFRDKVTAAQDVLTTYAMQVITRSIRCNNLQTSKWFLDRQDRREFHAQRVAEYRIMKKLVISEVHQNTHVVKMEVGQAS